MRRKGLALLAVLIPLMLLDRGSAGTAPTVTSASMPAKGSSSLPIPTTHVHLATAPSSGSGQFGPQSLPIAVDGAKTPEDIPDALAYQHFIMAATDSPTTLQKRDDPLEIFLSPIGLSETDQTALVDLLDSVRAQLFELNVQAVGPSHRAELTADAAHSLSLEKLLVVDDTRAAFKRVLSPGGRDQLDHHIRENVKRHIVVY